MEASLNIEIENVSQTVAASPRLVSARNISLPPRVSFPGISSNRAGTHFFQLPNVPFWKHTLDLLLIVLILPAWLVLMGLIAIGIKIVSRGPVFFRQERIGYKNKPFICLKFRSMKINADTKVHSQHMTDLIHRADVPMTKLDKIDPRLIPFGSILRSTGLDELPQFVNILRREMSFVGPRPCTTAEFVQYAEWQKERFETLPGLTGLWQVSGKNRTTFNQMMKLDIQYAKNKTLWMDLVIISKTFSAIVSQVRNSPMVR